MLIKFNDEQTTQYNELNETLTGLNDELAALDEAESGEEAPEEEAAEEAAEEPAEEAAEEPAEEEEPPRTREEIQADIAAVATQIEALYSELLPKAQQVVDEFEGGADFDSLIEKYNEDTGMNKEPTATNGYAVAANSTTWDPAFTEGAMSIESVGQISGPVYGQNGIHVIYYLSDITPGAVPFDDVREKLYETTLDSMKHDHFDSELESWVSALNPKYDITAFNFGE